MIRVEIIKLLHRPRTWISVGLLCLLPTIVAVFLAVNEVAPQSGEGPALLGAVLSNGSLYPAAALAIVLPPFLPVAVAVVAGDAIAGEASAGTLRYLLLRPVGRTRLLVAKLVTIGAFLGIAVLSVAGTAYVVGRLLFDSAAAQAGVPSVSGASLTGARSCSARPSPSSTSAGR